MKKLLLVSLSAFVLAGCAGQSTLAKKTAFELGYDPSQVQVSDIDHGMYETTYTASINGKKYNCTSLGGNAWTFGVAISPKCVPVGGEVKGNKCDKFSGAIGRCK